MDTFVHLYFRASTILIWDFSTYLLIKINQS